MKKKAPAVASGGPNRDQHEGKEGSAPAGETVKDYERHPVEIVREFSQVKGPALLLLFALASRMTRTRANCWPSIGTVMRDSRLSRVQVYAHLATLQKAGELRHECHGHRHLFTLTLDPAKCSESRTVHDSPEVSGNPNTDRPGIRTRLSGNPNTTVREPKHRKKKEAIFNPKGKDALPGKNTSDEETRELLAYFNSWPIEEQREFKSLHRTTSSLLRALEARRAAR